MENFAMLADEEKKTYTIADIEALPEGERAELINGEMFMMATPSITHQRISGNLFFDIKDYIRSKGGSCEPFCAPFSVFPDESGHNYFEPDLAVVCHPEIIDDKGIHGGPDWVIEIVSPSSKYMDYVRKLSAYENAGVREYWIVDPGTCNVTVYGLEAHTVEQYTFDDEIPAGIYEDLKIRIKADSGQ